MNEKALRFLGLARRGRMLECGEEPVGAACRSGKARLLLIAQDAGDHTVRRAKSFCHTGKPPYITVPYTKEELGGGLGLTACALCAVMDPAMAKAFLEALDEPEQYADILAELTRQVERVKKRRQEEKAHLKNVKNGKK